MCPAEAATTVVEDRNVEGPHGLLRLRVYRPIRDAVAGLVWVHGGAFVSGDLEMPESDWVSRQLARRGIIVLSVDYQLSPTPDGVPGFDSNPHPGVHFPVASEEVSYAFAWAHAHTAVLGLPAGNWSIGGASAGGNLSAGAMLRLRDEGRPQPVSLVLAYPLLHARLPHLRDEFARKIATLPSADRFDPAMVQALNLNYVQTPAALDSPYAFPGGHDLQGLPPTFIVTSDLDSLRASGEQFASELAAVGVDLLIVREAGTRHGHLNEPDDPAATRSLLRMIAWLTGPVALTM